MLFQFKTWIFNSLAGYYKNNDTYKDINSQGLLERYLEGFGEELDQNFMVFLDNFTSLIDIEKANDKYLYHLGFILGTPPTFTFSTAQYRKLLAYVLSIYKIRGTELSYKVFFALMGYDVSIIEYPPPNKITYDSTTQYDGEDLPLYDSKCEWCSGYRIAITPIDYSPEELEAWIIPEDLIAQVDIITTWLQPINAKYLGLVKRLQYTDKINPEIIIDKFETNII